MQITSKCASYIRSVAHASGYRSVTSLAEACKCSVSLLSRVLGGERRATARLVQRLEDTLHLMPGTLKEVNDETAA